MSITKHPYELSWPISLVGERAIGSYLGDVEKIMDAFKITRRKRIREGIDENTLQVIVSAATLPLYGLRSIEKGLLRFQASHQVNYQSGDENAEDETLSPPYTRFPKTWRVDRGYGAARADTKLFPPFFSACKDPESTSGLPTSDKIPWNSDYIIAAVPSLGGGLGV